MMSQQSKKEFDCIAMKREAQTRIYEEIKNMTPQQQIEYFRNAVQTSQFREWWKHAKSFSDNHVSKES
ncbi:MAG: hypothetical protein KJ666_09110 [Bacteroidetes bacterium]|nr:hypothetical protein [Bacteroidota bacterium]MBU2584912.1 hypothetical protein [Bacteroidota bacterium]